VPISCARCGCEHGASACGSGAVSIWLVVLGERELSVRDWYSTHWYWYHRVTFPRVDEDEMVWLVAQVKLSERCDWQLVRLWMLLESPSVMDRERVWVWVWVCGCGCGSAAVLGRHFIYCSCNRHSCARPGQPPPL
jgi:hypothetical protein